MPTPDATSNVKEYTVSELSHALKRSVEEDFAHVRVRGEISGAKRAASGHFYMSLKDEKAVLDAVCWKGVAAALRFKPEDGLEVVCTGRLSTYPARSKYQIVIESMEPAGAGALMALLEERRRKLAAEGLFDAQRKKPIPYLPDTIGVITSPTGAVIRDILHRLADRFPRHVLVWPVVVQGEAAAGQIARAIEGFNKLAPDGPIPRPDLLICARGGGSLEDLWAFNEEIVVRAAAEGQIPLISAIGHETDTTLLDMVADMRAPTPTAAAEMAVPVRADLVFNVGDLGRRLGLSVSRILDDRRERVAGLARGLPRPRDLLALARQRVDDLTERLPLALAANNARHHRRFADAAAGLHPAVLRRALETAAYPVREFGHRLGAAVARLIETALSDIEATGRLLESLSYGRVLERGFAVVRTEAGAPLRSASQARPRERLDIELRDGHVRARVEPGGNVKRKPVKKSGKTDQGNLF